MHNCQNDGQPNLPDEDELPAAMAPARSIPAFPPPRSRRPGGATPRWPPPHGVKGIRIIRFDSFGLLGEVVAHPARHSFADIVDAGTVTPDPGAAACVRPDRRVFRNDGHPTAAFRTLPDAGCDRRPWSWDGARLAALDRSG